MIIRHGLHHSSPDQFVCIYHIVGCGWCWCVCLCVCLSAVEMFQHHRDLPVSAGWADESPGSDSRWNRLSDRGTVRSHSCFLFFLCRFLSGHNGHTLTALVFVYFKVFVLVLFQVWKVKKAFKIHVIWRGLTPTFLVNLYCFFSVVLWIKVNTDYSLTVNCSQSILQFGKLDESEKRTEHYDTLVRTSFIQNSAVWLCFDISEYCFSILFLRRWSICPICCILCVSAGRFTLSCLSSTKGEESREHVHVLICWKTWGVSHAQMINNWCVSTAGTHGLLTV